VQTIEFTAADANSELPPPMSVQEVENMTLAQKRMAAMIMEDTSGDVEALRAQQAAAEAEAAAAVGGVGIADDDDAAMEESDDEDEGTQAMKKREAEERERELERARAIQASSINTAGPMKIRTDYIPKRESMLYCTWIFSDNCSCSSRRQEGRGNDDMYNLWSTNSGRRVG
jgi:splicing factor 3A subunit 1